MEKTERACDLNAAVRDEKIAEIDALRADVARLRGEAWAMGRVVECLGSADGVVVSRRKDGHAGDGWYASYSEYPDEGSLFLGVPPAGRETR